MAFLNILFFTVWSMMSRNMYLKMKSCNFQIFSLVSKLEVSHIQLCFKCARKFATIQQNSRVFEFLSHCSFQRQFGKYFPLCSHYDALELSRDASKNEIKEAYLKLSKIYHPDKLDGEKSEKNEKTFLQIKEAYDVLSNDKERLDYDMRMFGRSSGVNRFDTGEYILRKEHSRGGSNQTKDESSESCEEAAPVEESKIALNMAQLLSKLYGAIFIIGITMYFLGKHRSASNDHKK